VLGWRAWFRNTRHSKNRYFDAFRHDFLDDPLIGIVGEISNRFAGTEKSATTLLRTKEAASKLARPAMRVGLAVATAGVSEIAGQIVDAGLKAGSTELLKASEDFWKREDGKRAAMDGFRKTLADLAAETKLVIVVDELDRCRPDYALSLLEVIKHFFDVPNVHFVLGANLEQLSNTVTTRYGEKMDGRKYLQKFITATMPLGSNAQPRPTEQILVGHFQQVSAAIELPEHWQEELISRYLMWLSPAVEASLRDMERLATIAKVAPPPMIDSETNQHLYAGLLVMKIVAPEMYLQFRKGKGRAEDFSSIFELDVRSPHAHHAQYAEGVWSYALQDEELDFTEGQSDPRAYYFENQKPEVVLKKIVTENIDAFELV